MAAEPRKETSQPIHDPKQKSEAETPPPSKTDQPRQLTGRRSVDINRLSDARSYSYYFVLVMCKDSDTAEALAKDNTGSIWRHPLGPDEAEKWGAMGKYSPRKLTLEGVPCEFCVLIDGSSDADFAITDVRWLSATAAEAVPGDAGTSVAVEGSVKVSEPRGVIFVDQIVTCTQALNVDASSVVWLLKPFFVGYDNKGLGRNNQDSALFINDIKPVMFIPYDIAGVFAETGGVYDMQWVGMANGATRMPQYSRAADGFTAKVGPTLKAAMANIQTQITKRYEEYYQCFIGRLKDAGLDQSRFFTDQNQYKRVEYIILLDPVYCSDLYRVNDTPQQVKDKGECEEAATLKQTIGGSLESAIRSVMQMSPQVKLDMTGAGPDKVKWEYKIHTSLRSMPDKNQVIYSVKRFASPKGGLIESLVGGASRGGLSDEIISRHLVIFDYIYTGLNTDILEFDLKMNLGLAYLQTATSANSFKEQLQNIGARSTHIDPNGWTNPQTPTNPVKFPVYFGSQAQGRGNNTDHPGTNIGASFTMAKHASLEVAEATVKIRGNTAFLETASNLSNPAVSLRFVDAVVLKPDGSNVCGATNSTTETQSTIGPMLMGDFPLLAKINIKMPQKNDDLQAFRDRTSYAANFWFEGHYYIYGIEHNFTAGEFTQTLQMIALPEANTYDFLKKNKEKAVAFTAMVSKCYDFVEPCTEPAKGQEPTAKSNAAGAKPCPTPEEKKKQANNKDCQDKPKVDPPPAVQTPQPQPTPPPPPPQKQPATNVPSDCQDIFAHEGPFPPTFQLSPNYQLKDLTTNTRISAPNYALRAVNGLSEKEIVCNLRALCVNIVEPLRNTYGASLVINSAFRSNSNSQHGLGEAVDVAFTNIESNSSAMFERAKKVVGEVPYDQFLLEKDRTFWLHISFTRGQSRIKQINKVGTINVSNKGAFLVGLHQI